MFNYDLIFLIVIRNLNW